MKTIYRRQLASCLAFTISLVTLVPALGHSSNVTEQVQFNLMPMPQSVQPQAGRLPITSAFSVAIKGHADDRLRASIARMIKRLAGRTVLTLPLDLAADENSATLV